MPKTKIDSQNIVINQLTDVFQTTKLNNSISKKINLNKILNSLAQKKIIIEKDTQRYANALSYHPPIYYLSSLIMYKFGLLFSNNAIIVYYFTRLTSTIFYFLSLYFIYKILTKLNIKPNHASNLLLFIMLNPYLLSIGVSVNNDIAVLFFSVCSIYFILDSDSVKGVIMAGLVTYQKCPVYRY
jgi:hypothetical protein